jgi:hypothetical protein
MIRRGPLRLKEQPMRRMLVAVVLGTLAVVNVVPAVAAPAEPAAAVNGQHQYQIDPAHGGAQAGDICTPPLERKWAVPLSVPCTGNVCTNNDASYPIVAGGRVFVTSQIYQSQAVVFALDQETGQTLWGPVGVGATATSRPPPMTRVGCSWSPATPAMSRRWRWTRRPRA